MKNKQLNNYKSLKNIRKELRSNSTPAERRLWSLINKRQLSGRKFRRQHSIGYYVVDFYCPEEKLVIELDGKYHLDPVSHFNDKNRDEWLLLKEIKVLRFDNKAIFEQPEMVLNEIKSYFKS